MIYCRKANAIFRLVLVFAITLSLCGCVKKWALGKVAGALAADGGTVFSGDNDPELVADALPFALKMYESLLEALPDNGKLLLATGKAFCMYSYAFVHAPADTVSDIRFDEKTAQLHRAKNLYLRSREYLLRSLEIRHPGIRALLDSGAVDSAVAMTDAADTAVLYWAGNAWMGAFTADKFDMNLAVSVPAAVALLRRLLELNESYGAGSIHDFFISYYGSMPASMGGSEKKAREHYARAVELSEGKRAGSHVSLATSVCVGTQNIAEFRYLLNKALAVDIDADPANRLANILSARKARYLLDNIDFYFLDDEDTTGETP